MRLYALHPERFAQVDLWGSVHLVGYLFVAFAARSEEEVCAEVRSKKIRSVAALWRNRAKPKLVAVQHELSDTFRAECELRTWPGGVRVSAWNHQMPGELLGTLRECDADVWGVEGGDERQLARVRKRLDLYDRKRAMRVLAGNGAPGP